MWVCHKESFLKHLVRHSDSLAGGVTHWSFSIHLTLTHWFIQISHKIYTCTKISSFHTWLTLMHVPCRICIQLQGVVDYLCVRVVDYLYVLRGGVYVTCIHVIVSLCNRRLQVSQKCRPLHKLVRSTGMCLIVQSQHKSVYMSKQVT